MDWSILINKKIIAMRGFTRKKSYFSDMHTPIDCILFDDGETFIELSEQDKYEYHDCSLSARNLELRQDAKRWKIMFDKQDGYNESDLICPF